MDDRALVAGLRSGDPAGLAGVYDAYAERLLAYAVTLLRDRDTAADAVHDALLIARERAGQLRDPDRLRPWLYAITRNECLRELRDRRRAAPLDAAGDVIDETAPDLGAGARAAELRELVWSAAAALNPGEREVLELSVRHGLEGADLAAALGRTPNQAHAMSSRARAQMERSLGALLVARANTGECPDLDALLLGWDGTLTPLLRKRLARHVDECDICGETKRHRLNPVALLAGMPFVLAPPELRERVLGDARLVSYDVSYDPDATDPLTSPHGRRVAGTAGAAAALGAALAERGGPWRPDGFPRPLDRRRIGGVWLTSAAAAVVVLLLLIVGLNLRQDNEPTTLSGGTDPGASPTATEGDALPTPSETVEVADPTATGTTSRAPTTRAAAPTPEPTPAATTVPPAATRPAPTRTTPAPPTTTRPTATQPPAKTPGITLSAEELRADCEQKVLAVQVTATVTGTQASSVTLTWTTPRGKQSAPMIGDGATWTHTLVLATDQSTPAGATADTPSGPLESSSITLLHNCPG